MSPPKQQNVNVSSRSTFYSLFPYINSFSSGGGGGGGDGGGVG